MKANVLMTGLILTLLIQACSQDNKAVSKPQAPEAKAAQGIAPQATTSRSPPLKRERQDLISSAPHSLAMKEAARLSENSTGAVLDSASLAGHAMSPTDRNQYADLDTSSLRLVDEHPLSTFSVDVDSGAYAIVRSYLKKGQLPPSNAVRIEEMINYFEYDYPLPEPGQPPFTLTTELTPTPWNEETMLLQIGLQGYQVPLQQRPASNLVFLIDVSGSMQSADKLPLLKSAFRLLVNQMDKNDRISLVVYAGSSGVVLQPTAGDQKATLLAALDGLSAGGSTHGSAGIELAYAMAEQAFIEQGINRVILATDGDFNVGMVNHQALLDLIERKKRQGIALTTLGFGQGNYNDHLMEQLADHGDGNYAYIDSLNEARKSLVQQLSSTLLTIARDVKIQIEWNPDVVAEYRLIGYENRLLNREDFNNDKVDAGDIGAGHSVTALYEITLKSSALRHIAPLRYQSTASIENSETQELAFIKLRYKKPDEEHSQLIEQAIRKDQISSKLSTASDNLRFTSAVAAFGELLRGGEWVGEFDYSDVLKLAQSARASDTHGYRGEFLGLVELAQALDSSD